MIRGLLALALLLVFSTAGAARAAGDEALDPSFDGDGKALVDFGASSYALGVVVQPDGKIVSAGTAEPGGQRDFAVARQNPDGSLDPTFGTGGKVVTDLGGWSDEAYAVALQSDGKIVVVGITNNPWSWAVVRYNPDGTLDSTFGGDGIVLTEGMDRAYAVAIQPNGAIVVGGESQFQRSFAFARYLPDGTLDAAFGAGGISIVDVSSGPDWATGVAIQADGKIVGSGVARNATLDFALVRLNADGSADSTFDSDGIAVTDFGGQDDHAHELALQADGSIVSAGSSYSFGTGWDYALTRHTPTGALDPTFDGDGKVTTDFAISGDEGWAISIHSDGKLVVAGRTEDFAPRGREFGVVRYLPNGALDVTFDDDGKVTTDFPGTDEAYAVDIQVDGRIVVAGHSNYTFALARYLVGALPPAPQCADTVDNDGDGRIDLPADPGCSSATDDSESPDPAPPAPQCADGVDNDGDGRIDFPADPGCSSATDDSESPDPAPPAPQCSDGVDNDGDGKVDFPADPGCSSATDDSESPDPIAGSTPGKVTGGGWIGAAKHSFGFNARYASSMAAPRGNLEYHDKQAGLRLRSTSITTLTVVGTHAVITGTGNVDGVRVEWRIEVDDLGEPGRRDTFRISWPGYAAAGTLGGGNIQIHGR